MMTDNEINEAVARKLGWVLGLQFWNHKDKGYLLRNPPPYSTDIKAAWEVVDYVCAKGYSVTVGQNPCRCLIWKTHEDFNSIAEADTAPRAICEAFLKLP